jgi:hypothetical protein
VSAGKIKGPLERAFIQRAGDRGNALGKPMRDGGLNIRIGDFIIQK